MIALTTVKGQTGLPEAVQKRLAGLPLLPLKQETTGEFSSHSEHQHNADMGNFLYRDEKGDAVIFEVHGPGRIKSMWGAVIDSAAMLKFYFDGEVQPRYSIKAIDLYTGTHQNFPLPLVSYDRRGYYIEQSYAGNS